MDSPTIIQHVMSPAETLSRWRKLAHRLWAGALLSLILLAAAGLRFHGLDRQSLWGDEYVQSMQHDLPPSMLLHGSRTINQPPLDCAIGWALAKISRTIWTVRAPAAFFGVCGVGAVFLLARRLFDARVGLLAASLLAVTPLHWKLSQEARPYVLLALSVTLTLWLLDRALERATRRRVLAFGLCAYLMTLTRGLAPLVMLLAIGIVLTIAWQRERGTSAACAIRRVWLATAIAGVAAIPMLLFLLAGDTGWTVFGAEVTEQRSWLAEAWSRLSANAMIWAGSVTPMFGAGGWLMVALAFLGAISAARRWRHWTVGGRCTLATIALVGPLFLLVYSATVESWPINSRYALFCAPLITIMAAAGMFAFVDVVRRLEGMRAQRKLGGAIALVASALVVALPAQSTWALTDQYFFPDWRGTAAYLGERYDGDDVVMVFADKPLGAGQPPYWGKLDWPADRKRPLGESMWVLAVSEPHWQRLLSAEGRCCVVIKYFVGEQDAEEFRGRGLQGAAPPVRLTKFRGLDVLEGFGGLGTSDGIVVDRSPDEANLPQQVIAACDYLLKLPREHADSAAILYLLRSRMQLHAGASVAARESYEQAEAVVPQHQRRWFAAVTAAHRTALHRTGVSATP